MTEHTPPTAASERAEAIVREALDAMRGTDMGNGDNFRVASAIVAALRSSGVLPETPSAATSDFDFNFPQWVTDSLNACGCSPSWECEHERAAKAYLAKRRAVQ